MILIRAFRAIDEPQTCQRFLDGHRKVLEEFNLENISSNTPRWISHPNTYVVIAEYLGEIVGGIRIQIADGDFPLPVEDAVGHYDANIHKLVRMYQDDNGCGEICGLWNSRKFAPKVGITVLLGIAVLSVCDQLRIKNMFVICASYTLPLVRRMGFEIERSVGNNGEFVYPNSNFVARVLRMNVLTVETASAQHKIDILALRKDRHLQKKINIDSEEINLIYDLDLKNITHLVSAKE